MHEESMWPWQWASVCCASSIKLVHYRVRRSDLTPYLCAVVHNGADIERTRTLLVRRVFPQSCMIVHQLKSSQQLYCSHGPALLTMAFISRPLQCFIHIKENQITRYRTHDRDAQCLRHLLSCTSRMATASVSPRHVRYPCTAPMRIT